MEIFSHAFISQLSNVRGDTGIFVIRALSSVSVVEVTCAQHIIFVQNIGNNQIITLIKPLELYVSVEKIHQLYLIYDLMYSCKTDIFSSHCTVYNYSCKL